MKFVNRTKRKVQIHWINEGGHLEERKSIGAGRCWRTLTFEGDYWVATDKHDDLLLNYGEFYMVPALPASFTPGYKERVIITEGEELTLSQIIYECNAGVVVKLHFYKIFLSKRLAMTDPKRE